MDYCPIEQIYSTYSNNNDNICSSIHKYDNDDIQFNTKPNNNKLNLMNNQLIDLLNNDIPYTITNYLNKLKSDETEVQKDKVTTDETEVQKDKVTTDETEVVTINKLDKYNVENILNQLNDYEKINFFESVLKELSKTIQMKTCNLLQHQNKLLGSIKSCNDDIKILESLNSYTENIINKDKDIKTKYENITKQITELGTNIYNSNTIKHIKNDYLFHKYGFDLYQNLIRKFNIGSLCPLCMNNKCDTCCYPCGHTYCKECLEINENKHSNNKSCAICRTEIIKQFKIYN